MALLLAVPMWLLGCAFLLPAQYSATFSAALQDKVERLQSTQAPRIVLLGGSSLPFGVDGALLQQELPGYTVVNLGLYAALGTEPMMDLALEDIRAGDIIILSPEQNPQALSLYFSAETMWQAADGNFELLCRLSSDKYAQLLGQLPYFAAGKLRNRLQGEVLQPAGVYRRGSFDAYGSIATDCPANTMPDGWDSTMPISFSAQVLADEFADAMNQFAAQCAQKGATVYYRFPPMNVLAVSGDLDDYCAHLRSKIQFPLLGNPHSCVLGAEWFFDTNFHLNSAGKAVNTVQLINDIKAVLGNTAPTQIALPAPPSPAQSQAAAGDNRHADCFTYEHRETVLFITGLTAIGAEKADLIVPAKADGIPVAGICTGAFASAANLQTLTIQNNIATIQDGAFAGCAQLNALVLWHTQPDRVKVGQNLLEGTNASVFVPESALNHFKLDYTWAMYANRLKPIGKAS